MRATLSGRTSHGYNGYHECAPCGLHCLVARRTVITVIMSVRRAGYIVWSHVDNVARTLFL